MKKGVLLLLLSLVLVVGGSFLAFYYQTGEGEVIVKDLRFAGKDGKILSALLFIPEGVDDQHPAPAVLTMHGYINSRETQSGFNIEFARRGYVVLAMDMAGHGFSEGIPGDISRGADDGLLYLNNLPFVDSANIAVEGHSMGGWSVLVSAGHYPELVKTVILAGSSPETYGAPKVTAGSEFNFGVIYSRYDEFARLMWGIEKAADIVQTEKLQVAFGTTETVRPEELYGSFPDQSARILYIPDCTHPGDHLSREAIGYAVDFLQRSISAPRPLEIADQVWPYKETGTAVAFGGLVLFMLAVGSLLLKVPYFTALTGRLPESAGMKGLGWFVGALLATAIPAVTFFKFQHLGSTWFPVNKVWPQSLTNGFITWAVLTGLIAVGLFILWHLVAGMKQGGNAVKYGLSTSTEKGQFNIKLVGRSLLLAILVTSLAYILLRVMYGIFLVDFRWWVVALKPMDFSRFIIFLKYLVPFVVFFIFNGLVLHGQLRLKEYGSKGKTLFIWSLANMLINSLGLAALVALQVGHLWLRETLFFPAESLLGIVAYQFIPLLAIAALISTFFYRKTGNIYTGAFINGIFITWYIVAGQAIQFVG